MRKGIFTLVAVIIMAMGITSCSTSTDSLEEVVEESQFDATPSLTDDEDTSDVEKNGPK